MTPPDQSHPDAYTRTAAELLALLGGASNLQAVAHCITRLRLTLAERHHVDDTSLRDHPAVLGRRNTAEGCHLIVGPAAAAPLARACTNLLAPTCPDHDDSEPAPPGHDLQERSRQ